MEPGCALGHDPSAHPLLESDPGSVAQVETTHAGHRIAEPELEVQASARGDCGRVGGAEIELALLIVIPGKSPAQRSFVCRNVERTYTWPTAGLIGRVLDACLANLGGKLRTDPVWLDARAGSSSHRFARAW